MIFCVNPKIYQRILEEVLAEDGVFASSVKKCSVLYKGGLYTTVKTKRVLKARRPAKSLIW